MPTQSKFKKKLMVSKETSVDKLTTVAALVKENPSLVNQWAQQDPWKTTALVSLAVGSYVGYSQATGEYKIPPLNFDISENVSIRIGGEIGVGGEVKNLGVTLKWKF